MRTAESRAAWRYASAVLGLVVFRLNEVGLDLRSIELRDIGDDYIVFDFKWNAGDGPLRHWKHMITGAALSGISSEPSIYADVLIDRLCEETQTSTEEVQP